MNHVRSKPSIQIKRLSVTRFRSYRELELELDASLVVLTGANGAGKTNLLEAISMMAPGRGLRSARLSEMTHRAGPATRESYDAAGWAVALDLETPEGPRQLGTGLDRQAGNGASATRERRLVKVDGQLQRGQAPLSRVLRLIWLTPQMDGLFLESAAERRRFLDRLVVAYDPEHSGRVHAYDYAVRERQRLFREGIDDPAWHSSLEDAMARHGVALAVARRVLVGRLAQAAASGAGPFPSAGLEISCAIDAWLNEGPALAAEDRLKSSLAARRAEDRESGTTGLGPHRADLEVTHRGKGMPARLCSTGEQKALLTSIILAHTRLLTLEQGVPPILLLDEVVAHLDAERRSALFTEIQALGVQAWMTGTDRAVFEELGGEASFFALKDSQFMTLPRESVGNAV